MASCAVSCRWQDCSFSCASWVDLKQHVASHCGPEILPACLWSDCGLILGHDAAAPDARLRRHLLGHCHLLELSSLGDHFRVANALPPCLLEVSITQEIVAGFFQDPQRCAWDECSFESDDLAAFWEHARAHLRRQPIERGLPWVCKWRGCPDGRQAKKFSNQANLKAHLQRHTNEKAMACSACRRQFAAAENFRDHLLKQNGSAMRAMQGTFRCKLCPLSFARRRLLGSHVRSAHRPAEVCGLCERRFSSLSAIRRHQAAVHPSPGGHSVIQERCPLCPAEFRSRQGLLDHARAKHSDAVYRCTACAFETSYYSTLWKHVFAEHEQRRHACHECGLLVADPKDFRHHLREHGLLPDKGFMRFRFSRSEANLIQLKTNTGKEKEKEEEEGEDVCL